MLVRMPFQRSQVKTQRYYSEQFSTSPHPLAVTIPQIEIVHEVLRRGEQSVYNDVCLAVAVVADAVASAQSPSRTGSDERK